VMVVREGRAQLLCYKHKTRGVRWQAGPLLSGTFASTGDLHYYVTGDLVHVAVRRTPRRHADFFLEQTNALVEVLTTLALATPAPAPAAPAPAPAPAAAAAATTTTTTTVSASASASVSAPARRTVAAGR
jgi:hypothetical protein